MAKRRKKSSRRRSRRVSGVQSTFTDILAVAAGAAAGRIVSQKLFPNLDPRIKSAGVIALGAFAMPKLIKGGFGQSLGMGMTAAGSLGLLQETGVIGAIDDALDGVGEFNDVGAIEDIGAIEDEMGAIEDFEAMGAMDEFDM